MRVVIIGANGHIGKAVVEELKPRHEVIRAGLTSGEVQIDITSSDSIDEFYATVKNIDAIILATGKVKFDALKNLSHEDYQVGLDNKLMGQVNVVLKGLKHINDKGSFSLTSGILNRDPIPFGSSAAMVNGAIDAFVRSSSIEMMRGIRINCISPTVLTEAMDKYDAFFRGYVPVDANIVAKAYSKSVEGLQTGQVFTVG
jgi:NAD(P)-dependent dehydrogenase (short-subunit alcohol dehydrogenase family)